MFQNSYFNLPKSLFFLVLIALGSVACNNDQDKDGIPDDKDKCPKIAAPNTKDGCPLPEQKLSKVHLFIETSASMGGYFKNDAQYKEVISDLAVKVHNFDVPLDIWFVADSMSKYKRSVTDFTKDIATTRIADQKSSELHKIISEIASKTDSNDVSILVSDCILSFPVKDIKANWEINKTDASSTLKNNIYDTFSSLKKRGLATSVYAFRSKFYGVYYDYQNVKTKLNGESRPYYIWVIGSTGLLSKFDDRLTAISSFHPEEALHFGLLEEVIKDYNIIPGVERTGKWKAKSGSVEGIVTTASEPAQFCVALNLAQLPAYARDIKYLEENLQVECKGCKATVKVKNKADADVSKLKTDKQKNQLEAATHVFLVSVNEMNLSNGNIKLSLPLKYDNWYKNWSTMDDKEYKSTANKTFAFEHLITGVIEAYETKNKNLIDLSITLTK